MSGSSSELHTEMRLRRCMAYGVLVHVHLTLTKQTPHKIIELAFFFNSLKQMPGMKLKTFKDFEAFRLKSKTKKRKPQHINYFTTSHDRNKWYYRFIQSRSIFLDKKEPLIEVQYIYRWTIFTNPRVKSFSRIHPS